MTLLENKKLAYRIGEIGVYLYTLSLMVSKVGINISLGLMILGLIGIVIKKEKLTFIKEEKIIFLFLILLPIFSLLSPGGVKSFSIAFQKNYRYLGIFLIPIFLTNKEILKKVVGLVSISFIICFVNAMKVYKDLGWNMASRFASFSENTLNEAHMLAMLSMFFFVIFIYSLKNSQIKIKIYNFIIFILSIVALVLSQGRGAWIATVGSFIFILILLIRENKKAVFVFLAVFLLLGGITQTDTFKNNQYVQRIKSIKDIDNDSPKIRLLMWEGAANIFKKNPVFGVGRDNSGKYYLDYFEKTGSYSKVHDGASLKRIAIAGNAHSMYFTSLCEEGLLAFVFVAMLAYIFYEEVALYRKSKDNLFIHYVIIAVTGMLVAFCIGGLTEDSWREIWKSNTLCWGIGLYIAIKKNYLNLKK